MGMQLFNFEECKKLILQAVLDALEQKKADLQAFPKHPNGTSTIRGMSLDIFPWHSLIQISFCGDDDIFSDKHIAEWKYFDFVSSNADNYNRSLEIAADYISSFWEDEEGEEEEDGYFIERRLRAHIIFLAGAEAVLDKQVADFLLSCGLDQVGYSEHPFDTGKFFLVHDDDQTLKANYCEIIKANRATGLFFEEFDEAKHFNK